MNRMLQFSTTRDEGAVKARRPVRVITRGEEDMRFSVNKTFIARLSPCRNAVRRARAELTRLIRAVWTSSPSPGCSQMALAGQGRETQGACGGAGDGDAARHYGSICAAWSPLGRTEEKTFSLFCHRAQLNGTGFKLFFGLGLHSFNATNATLITSS